jgi:hypothetical protein
LRVLLLGRIRRVAAVLRLTVSWAGLVLGLVVLWWLVVAVALLAIWRCLAILRLAVTGLTLNLKLVRDVCNTVRIREMRVRMVQQWVKLNSYTYLW